MRRPPSTRPVVSRPGQVGMAVCQEGSLRAGPCMLGLAQRHFPIFLDFWAGRKSSILGILAAPGDWETLPKDGELRPPPFGRVSRPPGAAQRRLSAGPKILKNGKMSLSSAKMPSGPPESPFGVDLGPVWGPVCPGKNRGFLGPGHAPKTKVNPIKLVQKSAVHLSKLSHLPVSRCRCVPTDLPGLPPLDW